MYMNEESLRFLIDRNVRLCGRAENAKGGAIVILQNQEIIYIRDLPSWDDGMLGNQVVIKGIIRLEKYIPGPEVAENGAISQGAIGLQYVLDDAEWSMAKVEE